MMNYRALVLGGWLALGLGLSTGAWTEEAPVTSTVAQLFEQKDQLNGKQVKFAGKVVKVTNHVMNRNFLHVQDGSGQQGSNDVTVTTDQTVNVGDQVTIIGTLATNRDFGSGYTYPLLVEQAKVEMAAAGQ